MTRIGDLAVNDTFKRPGGTHIYQVTEQVEENCGSRIVFCNNLTSGTYYGWPDYQDVIRVFPPNKRKRFWMCYVDQSTAPEHKHWSEQDGIKEAERLTKLTGKEVFLLVATMSVKATKPEPPTVWKETAT